MRACPHSEDCSFGRAVEASIIKRVKYAAAYPFCRGGSHDKCALLPYVLKQTPAPPTLLPTGGHDNYQGFVVEQPQDAASKVLVVEESSVFRTLACNAAANCKPQAEVKSADTFEAAVDILGREEFALVICADRFSGGRCAADLRGHTSAPFLVLHSSDDPTADLPPRVTSIARNAGPQAMKLAIDSMMA